MQLRHWREAYADLNVSIGGKSARIGMQIWGRYGDKWRLLETADTRQFYYNGRATMPPEEWTVQVNVTRLYPPPRHPELKVVA